MRTRRQRWIHGAGYGLLAASVVGAGLGLACVPQRAGHVSRIPPMERWERVSPRGTGFSVAMPGKPEVSTGLNHDFDGTRIRTMVGRLVAADAAVFGFVVIDAPGGFVQDPYAKARKAASGDDDDDDQVVRVEEEYEANGFLVSDRVTENRDDGIVMYMRLYVGKTRAYGTFLAMAAPAESHLQPVIDGYFGSVQLDPAQAVTPVGDGLLRPDRWEFIYPPEADFAIRMPGSAKGLDGQDEFGDEEVFVRRYGVQSVSGDEVFEVVVTRFGDGPPDGAIDTARRGWEQKGYDVRTEQFVHSRGFGGRSIEYRNAEESVHVSYYKTMTRLYEVRVRHPRERGAERAQARRWFFDSFRIF